MDVYEALYTTRAMRRLKPDPIPLDAQARILDAAIRAPSGSNSQPWHFLLVDDPGLKRHLAPLVEAVWNQRTDASASASARPAAAPMPAAMSRSVGHLVEHFAQVPLLFFGFGQPERHSSVYPALWNAQLAARAEGIGSTLTTFFNRFPEETFAILGVPEDEGWQVYGCLTMGYPTGRWGVAARRPAHEVAGRNGWDAPLGFDASEPLWSPQAT
ncbi:MAG TPA: nitroreductase family protein [Thermomicrobiales bacterium]|nr:nitroreductase family protein [Thermomicrobiales bacterium]